MSGLRYEPEYAIPNLDLSDGLDVYVKNIKRNTQQELAGLQSSVENKEPINDVAYFREDLLNPGLDYDGFVPASEHTQFV